VVVALPSVRNGFVLDDRWVVSERPLLRHPPSLAALVAEPYWPAAFQGALWRPTVLVTFALDFRVSGDPRWFHAVNVLWAGLATGLLTLLAATLAGPGIGLVTGLLFAVHPVHVEATASIVGRAELIAAAAYGAALLCALRAARRRRWLIGVALAAAVAVGAKEHAATLPVAVLLVVVAHGGGLRRAALPAAVALVPVLGYLVVRAGITHGAFASGGLAPGLEGLAAPERAWAMLALSLQWWRLLAFPFHLSADYSPADVSVSTGLGAAHLAAAALWLGTLWAAWRLRRRAPVVALGLAWMGLTLLPVSNIVPTEVLIAERTLYLPSWGFLVAATGAASLVPWPRRAVVATVVLLVTLGAVRSLARADVWRDDGRWFAALERDAPRSYRTLWLQGNDAFRAGRWGTGERLLRAASVAAPGIPGPLEDLAAYYARAGLWPQATALFRRVIELNPRRSHAWQELTEALVASGDSGRAAATATRAAARFPGDAGIVGRAADLLLSVGRCGEAAALLHTPDTPLPPAMEGPLLARAVRCPAPPLRTPAPRRERKRP
jgi:hypothetical protein